MEIGQKGKEVKGSANIRVPNGTSDMVTLGPLTELFASLSRTGRSTENVWHPEKNVSDPKTMPTSARDEIDAKLQVIEARMDARVARIEGKIDTFLAAANEREKGAEKERAARQQALDERDKRLEQWVQRSALATEEAKGVKRHFWASVAAQFAGVAAIIVAAYFANQQSMIGIAQITNSIYQQNQNSSQTKSPK